MLQAPSWRCHRLLSGLGRRASGLGCPTLSRRAPEPLRPQWQRMVLPLTCAKVTHSNTFQHSNTQVKVAPRVVPLPIDDGVMEMHKAALKEMVGP